MHTTRVVREIKKASYRLILRIVRITHTVCRRREPKAAFTRASPELHGPRRTKRYDTTVMMFGLTQDIQPSSRCLFVVSGQITKLKQTICQSACIVTPVASFSRCRCARGFYRSRNDLPNQRCTVGEVGYKRCEPLSVSSLVVPTSFFVVAPSKVGMCTYRLNVLVKCDVLCEIR